jgi:hypothetical protein
MKRSLNHWRDMEPNYVAGKVSRLTIKKTLEDAKSDIIELYAKLDQAYIIEPMDTAPRDATEVDLFLVGGERVMNASWVPSDGCWTGGYSDEDCLAWMKSPTVDINF